jgi:hypothetical protein
MKTPLIKPFQPFTGQLPRWATTLQCSASEHPVCASTYTVHAGCTHAGQCMQHACMARSIPAHDELATSLAHSPPFALASNLSFVKEVWPLQWPPASLALAPARNFSHSNKLGNYRSKAQFGCVWHGHLFIYYYVWTCGLHSLRCA